MNTQVKAFASSPPINTSLILFVKMAASAAAVKSRLGPWRGVIGGLAIECGVMRNLMILAERWKRVVLNVTNCFEKLNCRIAVELAARTA